MPTERICMNCLQPVSECDCVHQTAGRKRKKAKKKKVKIEYRLRGRERKVREGTILAGLFPSDWEDYWKKYATMKDAKTAMEFLNKTDKMFEYRMKE